MVFLSGIPRSLGACLVPLVLIASARPADGQPPPPGRQIVADVVALDQVIMLNRRGASMPNGMVFALKRDVVPTNCYIKQDCTLGTTPLTLVPGQVMLRQGKRPRPLVLRVNVGDTLTINFWNLLNPKPVDPMQPATRSVSLHVMGMEWTRSSLDDGSLVDANPSSLVPPSTTPVPPTQPTKYVLYAKAEGSFLLYSTAADVGGFLNFAGTDNAQPMAGLFGAVNVQPGGARYYRSQVTRNELALATKGNVPDGHPIINYEVVYPPGAGLKSGQPVLNMLDAKNNIVYSDLTAIIRGPFTPTPPANYAEPQRQQSYREFTIHYHEVADAVQAFPDYFPYGSDDGAFASTINPGNDNFAINYGTGGIGSEILANRFGVGPEGGCPDCRFEEFFLSAWAVGDPAQVVDVPANSPCTPQELEQPFVASVVKGTTLPNPPCTVTKGNFSNGVMRPVAKARQAFYPDDPSNVYHSYINDHVIFRILHAGAVATHVHHQHAHQWLKTDDSDNSTYLDSQMITMGASYTLNISYNGSGNRNKTVGDSIFHCHFYPHFASGMWSMWRSHDVFEEGSHIIPPQAQVIVDWNRMLPDGEIAKGTPIPAIVPLPDLPMAPMPARVRVVPVNDPTTGANIGYTSEVNADDLAKGLNPGFPFFIPGIAGRRAPHPALDFAKDEKGQQLDGGLPRHVVLQGTFTQTQTALDFSKDLTTINALELPEDGTVVEKAAMAFHAKCLHASAFPDGKPGNFRTNGLPPAPGAPFADPALDPAFEDSNRESICTGNQARPLPTNMIRKYKAAAFQLDLVFNKQGYHFPQSRILSLWSDVQPTLGAPNQVPRPPQPFFFRAASGEAVEYWHTNLIPDYYLLDDFQVRTPTDIIGQHIHLVKFDVTSSDGAGNGFNYEDGTFSPNEVRARLDAINKCGGMLNKTTAQNPFAKFPACGDAPSARTTRKPVPPPQEICNGTPSTQGIVTPCPSDWLGAQTTVQRWFADPLLNNNKTDRTIRTIFTHDHFGPSTHQQTGLYSAMLAEPAGSQWFDNETGQPMGRRPDGGPTSWQAVIRSPGPSVNTYREFALALQDMQLAYTADSPAKAQTRPFSKDTPTWASADPAKPTSINAPGCPSSNPTQPCPTIVSSGGGVGMGTVNYRNEPFVFRVSTTASNTPPVAPVNDLSFVFKSLTGRGYNTSDQPQPGAPIGKKTNFLFPPALTRDLVGPDPYTPLLRAYTGDNVQVRVIAGAHQLPHTFGLNGVKWLVEPGTPADPGAINNSGYRDTEAIGISEHFEMLFPLPRTPVNPNDAFTDYFYLADSNTGSPNGMSDGMWGLLRGYQSLRSDLMPLFTNPQPAPLPPPKSPAGYSCPTGKSVDKTFNITAIPAVQLPIGTITLNARTTAGGPITSEQQANNTTISAGLLYVVTEELKKGQVKIIEPLILRVNAGDCIQVNLTNGIDLSNPKTNAIFTNLSSQSFGLSAPPSTRVGLRAQMMAYNVLQSSGTNVGFNPTLTAEPGKGGPGTTVTYYWYAGNLQFNPDGAVAVAQPVELGGLNLLPSDPIQQGTQGLVASLIVEPPNTSWCLDANTRAQAYIYPGQVTCPTTATPLFRELVVVSQDDFNNSFGTSDAVNYRTEPLLFRFGQNGGSGNWAGSWLFEHEISCKTGNGLPLVQGDPQTPVFQARAGEPVRLRMLHPGGGGNEQVMTVYGHVWQEEPYQKGSTVIGPNPLANWQGSRDEHGSNDHFEILVKAGGEKAVPGDYLIRTYPSADFQGGLWSTLRVCLKLPCPPPPPAKCPPMGPAPAPAPTAAAMAAPAAPATAAAPGATTVVNRFIRKLHTGGTAVDHGRAVPRGSQPKPEQPEDPKPEQPKPEPQP